MTCICNECRRSSQEIIRGYCRKCYNALRYKGSILKIEKPEIDFLSLVQHELLVGSLLGDASLHRNSTSKFAHLKIERASKDLDYLKFQFDILNPLCKSGCKEYNRKSNNKKYCYFITRSYEILDDYYRKWYPNGIKIIPRDIEFTPLVIAIWLCDDGCISLHHKKQKLLTTTFATNGFTKNDTKWLALNLSNRYNENFVVYKTSIENQYVIRGAHAATKVLYDDIKKVFPISMNRKLKEIL